MLAWATDNHYVVTSITHIPADAAALAEAGLIDVVVLICHTRATLEMAGRVGQTKASVDEIRPSNTPLQNHDRLRAQILDAARRKVAPEAIAAVLDIPLSTVHEALGIASARPAGSRNYPSGRRPRRLTVVGPPGRP